MAAEFTDANFTAEVLNSPIPVLVDFWATWCGPCKMMGPVIEKVAKDLEGKVKVGKLDVDANPHVAAEYGIQSIPTLIMFKGGKAVGNALGFKPEPQIKAFIAQHS